MSDDGRIAAWTGALVAAVFLALQFDANDGNTDAEVHFQQVRAMATRGSWAFEPDNETTRAIIDSEAGPMAGASASQKGVDGRVYGHFGPFYVLAATPLYGIGAALAAAFPAVESAADGAPFLLGQVGRMHAYLPRVVATAISPLFLGLAVAAIVLAARRLRASRGAAVAAGLAYAFATFAGATARHGGSDTLAAALVALGVERALAARDTGRSAVAACGAIAGALVGTRYLALAAIPGVAFLAAASALERRPRSLARDLAAFAAPAAALAALVAGLNVARWGSPFDFGYRHSFETNQAVAGGIAARAATGLLLSFFAPSRGLAIFALPSVVLGAAGLVRLARRDRLAAVALAAGALIAAVPASLSIHWQGTWSWGPRYHLPVAAFLAPAAALAIDASRRAAAVAIGAGALVTLPALLSSPFAFLSLASEALRIERPTAAYPVLAYRGDEALAEADRQERIPIAMPWSPYGAVRGQWTFLLGSLAGRERYPVRETFGVDSGEVLEPQLFEWRGFRSPWWAAMGARTGGGAAWIAPVLLGGLALLATIRLRRALVRSRGAGDPRGSSREHSIRR